MKKILFLLLLLTILVTLLMTGHHEITTEITVNGPPSKTWKVFTDTSSYKKWNPFIISLNGDLKKGNTIEVTFKEAGSGTITFTPQIIKIEKNSLLQWRGDLLIPGIFTGVHTFKLKGIEGGKTRLIQRESFSGILVPFFNFDDTEKAFNAMNHALKRQVEAVKQN